MAGNTVNAGSSGPSNTPSNQPVGRPQQVVTSQVNVASAPPESQEARRARIKKEATERVEVARLRVEESDILAQIRDEIERRGSSEKEELQASIAGARAKLAALVGGGSSS